MLLTFASCVLAPAGRQTHSLPATASSENHSHLHHVGVQHKNTASTVSMMNYTVNVASLC